METTAKDKKALKTSIIILFGSLVAIILFVFTLKYLPYKWPQTISIVLICPLSIFVLISLYDIFRFLIGKPSPIPDSPFPKFVNKINKKVLMFIIFPFIVVACLIIAFLS